MLTWIGEFRPGNKTVYVVFDEESDFLPSGRNSFIQAGFCTQTYPTINVHLFSVELSCFGDPLFTGGGCYCQRKFPERTTLKGCGSGLQSRLDDAAKTCCCS
jgi:hypothetical protein